MTKSSVNLKRFEEELSLLVTESSNAESRSDLKDILIRLTALQRIIYEEIEQHQSTSSTS